MIKKIAIYENNLGEITDLSANGFVRIYSKNNDKWNVEEETPVEILNLDENILLDTLKLSEALNNCKVFVSKEIPELIHEMLNGFGISIWKMEGKQNEILEYVSKKEEEEEEEIKFIITSKYNEKRRTIYPKEIGKKGYYILSLKEIQKHNTGTTTKQALRPFLNNNNFNELIVICSHIPNWLEPELKTQNLNYEFSKTGQNDYIILINHNN
ncbi:Fe-only nitrogenase accessory AnfO family protein [Clostridium saccharoperbutylacetonicum]|uniref:Fe-only nitrogenase accessory AnfO family protein n=1 Tax=Clostridium saccharoperbutylacetonicum TaxID=36745 RepID=UPI000983B98B|nr:Fe-only nitrogenase accessory AnfO family protein [Clostridium saccharoperbutylacetonicum]AQR95484.1 iron only nitrogenase protein AnfO [Clostridium saccharoperbutylacetonicum]NSB31343.1 Fe-only nitrogenase accessory protein AnfO [Clostridium saccharoperbutylacetonicum]